MAAIWCCGAECGRLGAVGEHWSTGTNWTIETAIKRNGNRSFRYNPSASNGTITGAGPFTSSANKVWRDCLYFTTLPSADCILSWFDYGGSSAGIGFKLSDSKLYSAVEIAGVITFGTTGVLVSTGVFYVVDVKTFGSVVTGTCDIQVNAVACAQITGAFASANATQPNRGSNGVNISGDIYFDDGYYSETSGDYPLGDGYVDFPYVPTADGTHVIATTNDFERSLTGTDIAVGTTTAWQLVDDVPLKATTPTEFINMIASTLAGDYVECIFGPSAGGGVPPVAPRFVEVIALVAQPATTTGNMEIRLNDNGSMGVVYTATAVAGIIAGKYVRAGFADPPSAAAVWTLTGDGNFNNLKVRFGSPAALDVVPDQYFASIMIEAEFAPRAFSSSAYGGSFGQRGQRQMQQLLAT